MENRDISLVKVFWQDKWLAVGGSVVSFLIACWIYHIFGYWEIPVGYGGDLHFTGLIVSWLRDGWIFDIERSGWPFGSSMGDYPSSEIIINLYFKLLVGLTGSVSVSINIFFLTSFSFGFLTAFVAMRAFGVNRSMAIAGAFAYAFTSFHFYRIGHIYYQMNFLTPLVAWVGYIIYKTPFQKVEWRQLVWYLPIALLASSCGVYYAAFFLLILGTATLCGWIRSRSTKNIVMGGVLCATIVLGVGANIIPFKLDQIKNGNPSHIVHRLPLEAELYGLRLTQMVIPHPDHKLKFQRKIAAKYNKKAININENQTASLNALGVCGLVAVGCVLLMLLAGRSVSTLASYSSAVVLSLFMWATVGGLGSCFSYYINPSLRGWNRVSVVLVFFCLLLFFYLLTQLLQKIKGGRRNILQLALMFFLILFVWFDQIPKHTSNVKDNAAEYLSDKIFVNEIERLLPTGSSVYQLPYLSFPENGPIHGMQDYAQAVGAIHSKDLKWSYGVMKWRPGADFYSDLEKRPIEEQIQILLQLGFHGIWINRLGYPDRANELESKLSLALERVKKIESKDKTKVFYFLPQGEHVQN